MQNHTVEVISTNILGIRKLTRKVSTQQCSFNNVGGMQRNLNSGKSYYKNTLNWLLANFKIII